MPFQHDELHSAVGAEAVEAALTGLRTRGERITIPRQLVIETLAAQSGHLTADEVAEMLAHSQVHRATVYRTLDLLVETGIALHRVTHGAGRYHLTAPVGEHGHLHGHCEGCGRITPLPIDILDSAISQILADEGFLLDPQLSNLGGRCKSCIEGSDPSPSAPGPRSREH